MAIGIPPTHIREFPLDTLTTEQFLAIAQEAIRRLGYDPGYSNETGLLAYTPFSMSSWKEEIKITIAGNAAILQSKCLSNQLLDWGKNRRNMEAFVATFQELQASMTPEEMVLKGEELKQQWACPENEEASQPLPVQNEKMTGLLSIFKPTEGYFVTPLLINTNLLIFIAMVVAGVNVMEPDIESLVRWGANYRLVTLEGGWWRLLTCCFIHVGLIHLLMNMYALMYIGLLLEPYLGKRRLLVAYLLTGIMASLTSLYWHQLTVSAGASGAIFGLYGLFLAMLTTNLIEKSARQAMLSSILVFVGYNLLNGLTGNIDNAAHVGGLLSGFLMGYAFYPSLTRSEEPRLTWVTTGLLTVFVLTTSFITYRTLPNDVKTYETEMLNFASWEEQALGFYEMPAETTKADLLYELKDRGLYYWKKNIELLKEMERMDLPEPIHGHNALLLQYCALRVKSYELLYKGISEDSEQYKPQLETYDRQIKSIVDLLNNRPTDSK